MALNNIKTHCALTVYCQNQVVSLKSIKEQPVGCSFMLFIYQLKKYYRFFFLP